MSQLRTPVTSSMPGSSNTEGIQAQHFSVAPNNLLVNVANSHIIKLTLI